VAEAAALARSADAAVVVIGLDAEWESEGGDRASLALPGRQDELVTAVCAAQPRTAVVVNAGAPALLPWADAAPALLWAWYGGQEAGSAVTDVLLSRGAAKVYAVDVGRGQLAWKLRGNERVVNLEKTNIRYLTADKLPEVPDIAVIDASFISLAKILPATVTLLKDGGTIIALIKPQFEVGRGEVGKGGVVRDAGKHRDVIAAIRAEAENLGLEVRGVTESPILGPKGNREFLIYMRKAVKGEG